MDLSKDLLFALRLLTLVGGVSYVATHLVSFPSQIILISLTSALLPVILSAFIISSNPLIVTGFYYQNKFANISKWKMFLLRVLAFFFFPLIPALLFDVKGAHWWRPLIKGVKFQKNTKIPNVYIKLKLVK